MNQPWIYVVLIGLVLIVCARIVPRSAGNQSLDGSMLSEMEETMDHFAAELDEQNKALIQMFAETKKEFELHSAKLVYRVETLEKQGVQLQQEVSRLGYALEQLQAKPSVERRGSLAYNGDAAGSKIFEQHDESLNAAIPPEPVMQEPSVPSFVTNMKERYSELFELYQQGKSTDYIAKKLGKNKGEINLILQLAKQEELSDG